jgi:Na+-driven multidrug efflux pump
MQLSIGCGVAVGLVLWLAQGLVVGIFTQDAAVALAAGAVLPMVALLMPLDAAASIMDGGLIAASQTNLLSAIQVVGSLAQHAVLTWVVAQGWVSVLSVWGVLKMMSVFRAAGGWYVIFASPWSKYHDPKLKQA